MAPSVLLLTLSLWTAPRASASHAAIAGEATPGAPPCSIAQSTPSRAVADLVTQGNLQQAAGETVRALSSYQAAAAAEPCVATIYLKLGTLQGAAGNFEAARQNLRAALALDPSLAEAHYSLALTLVGLSKQIPHWNEALHELNTALAERQIYPEAASLAGLCLLELGEPEKAATEMQAAISMGGNTAATHFRWGRALEASGQGDEALQQYSVATQLDPSFAEAELRLARLLLSQGQNVAAVQHLRRALMIDPDIEEAHFVLAQALRKQGNTAEAQTEDRQVASLLSRQQGKVQSVRLSNESLDKARGGDLPAALQNAETAIHLDPENPIAKYNRGLLLADSKRWPEAAAELQKAISLSPLQAPFYASLARVHLAEGDTAAALQDEAMAARLNPNGRTAPPPKAATDPVSPSPPTAAAASSPFPFGSPTDTAQGHLTYASFLSQRGDGIGALGELLRAAELQPANLAVRLRLAATRADLGQTAAAELEFRNALSLEPSSIQAHLGLGTSLLKEGQCDAAAQQFRWVRQVNPRQAGADTPLTKCR